MTLRSGAVYGQTLDENPVEATDFESENELEKTQPIPEREAQPSRLSLELNRIRAQVDIAADHNGESEEVKDEDDDPLWLCTSCNTNLRSEAHSIGCDNAGCNRWFHPSCLVNENIISDQTWICQECRGPTYTNPDIPSVSHKAEEDQIESCPGEPSSIQLPSVNVILPSPVDTPSSIDKAVWGNLKGSEITYAVNHAHSKIVRWKKNLFKVPSGKAGQEFIEEVNKTLVHYVSGSHFESVALTMTMIMFPLLLQKP